MLKTVLNVEDLISDISLRLIPDLKAEMNDFVLGRSRRILTEIINNTPLETGRARASWHASLESLGGHFEGTSTGHTGETSAIAEGRSLQHVEVREDDQQLVISIRNDVDYMVYLEYGTSLQSPHFMVRKALNS